MDQNTVESIGCYMVQVKMETKFVVKNDTNMAIDVLESIPEKVPK